MTSTNLVAAVDSWTAMAVMASKWLLQLYRRLGDDRQAALADQAGVPATEKMNRLGLQPLVVLLYDRFSRDYPDETDGEQSAWMILVEAYSGHSAYFALSDTLKVRPHQGMQGARTAAHRALRTAVRGYQVAFPEEMVKPGVQLATRKAVTHCVAGFLAGFSDLDSDGPDPLRSGLEDWVLECLQDIRERQGCSGLPPIRGSELPVGARAFLARSAFDTARIHAISAAERALGFP